MVAIALGIVSIILIDDGFVNADGVSYLAITRHWAEGRWATAINGYWSPLLSILLVPADLVGIPLVPAAKVLAVLTAGAAVAALQRLMRVGGVDPTIAAIVAIGACPFAVFAALVNVTPDLLMATLFVFFVAEFVGGLERPVVAGLIGGAGFLSKAYFLPVAVVLLLSVFVALLVGVWFTQRDVAARDPWAMAALRRVVTAASVFAVVAFAWSVAISIDAGYPTISTAGEYNRVVTSPGARGNPYGWAGMIEPDDPAALWAWEDPSRIFSNIQTTQTIETGAETARNDRSIPRFERQITNVKRTIRSFALVEGAAVIATIAFMWAVFRAVPRLIEVLTDRHRRPFEPSVGAVLWSAFASAVYLGGLLFVAVATRYLFGVMLLTFALAGIGLSALADRFPDRRRGVLVLATVMAVATMGRPGIALDRLDERADEVIPLQEFLSSVDVDEKRLASVPALLGEVGGRCLGDGCVYLGSPVGRERDVIADQLDDFDIDILVVELTNDIEIPDRARLLTESADVGYAVYDVSEVEASS